MKTRPLSSSEKDKFNADLLLVLDYADVAGFTDATATPLLTVPTGVVIELVAMILDTPFVFSDTDILDVALEVGDVDDPDRYLASTAIAAAGTPVTKATGALATNRKVYLSAATVDATFTITPTEATTPALSTCTAGKVRLYLAFEDTNQLPRS